MKISGRTGAGTAALTGGDAFAGFMAGYGIGKFNHSNKGRWTRTNTGEVQFDLAVPLPEVTPIGKMPAKFKGIPWISQLDKRVPNAGWEACKRACYMMVPYAIRGMNGYLVGKEQGHSVVATNQLSSGLDYLNQQLEQGKKVIVGVQRLQSEYWNGGIKGGNAG